NSVNHKQYGLGVEYSSVKHIRDYFLDRSYRTESGRMSFYETSSQVMEEVENLLGEMNGEAFQNTLSDLWTSVQELAKDPANSVTQSVFVQRASEFILRGQAVYSGLAAYQDNLNAQIKQKVTQINEYGDKITELNNMIRSIESGRVENANDLRDTRDSLLDELSAMTDVTYSEDMYGNLNLQIEGVDFVKAGTCYKIDLDVDGATGFYTPFWPQNAAYILNDDGSKKYDIEGATVFNLEKEVSTSSGTDIGGLKAMLMARGDHRADYTDMDNYTNSVSQSVLMNIQAEFDQLIHSVVSKVNGILADAAGVTEGNLTLSDSTVLENVRFLEAEGSYYMRGETTAPLQVFSKINSDSYKKVTGSDGKEYWVYMEEDSAKRDSLYTVSNIKINDELIQNPSRLGLRLPDGSEDNATATALKEAFMEEKYTLNPSVLKKTSFVDYYGDLVSQIANSGAVFKSITDAQTNTVGNISAAREQVVGVSSDEELSNMIKYQNAYNASSRYITVVDEMLEHILATLGS
ncbi:MAG: flagellar hook-associated protein FlgK, partial [Lachnospiraceae bacterium]|nr:flagellar hook-associated protein FlgK [Lachnospiraceae bacterium]